MRSSLVITSILVIALAIGCATIFDGAKDVISFSSEPASAKITVETLGGMPVFSGATPTTFEMQRKNKYVVTFKLEGYQEQKAYINQT